MTSYTHARLLALLLLSAPLAAQSPKRPLRADDIYRLRDVHDPQRSPDGKWVAYAVTSVDTARDRNSSDIWMVSWDGAQQIQLTNTPESESSPAWSPDGKWLSFLSSRQGSDGSQLWLFNRLGGEPVRVTNVPDGIDDYQWSPDSKRLVFVVSDPDTTAAKGNTKRPIVIDRLHFKSDPGGYLLASHEHLALFDLASRTLESLTSGTTDETGPVWSPDGSRIAFESKRVTGDADRSDNDDIFVMDAKPGSEAVRLTTFDGEDDGRIAWSPDGTRIAYLTGIAMADHDYRMWKLAVVPSTGGASTILSAGLDRQVIEPAWSADGSSIYMLEEDDRSQYVAKIAATGGEVQRVAADKRMVTSIDIGRDGAATLTVASDSEPPEIYALEGTALRRLTHQNDEWLGGIQLGTTEEFASRAKDGYEVHGVIVKPSSYVAGRKYPTLLRIHGGPACCQDSHAFNIERELFAANGYVVIAANYRGSRGRGAAHQRAIAHDSKEKSVMDLLGAVDYAVKIGLADPEHLGIGGWSNGAILTDRIITLDHRFKGAIAGAGTANAIASFGTDQYSPDSANAPWTDPQEWLRRSYVFFHANQITTPTLFLGGDRDFNVPIAGSEQMYVALRIRRVPTELIIYPDQHHGISTPSYKKDRLERYVAWYDRYVKAMPAARVTSSQ
ncbi:MAG TPA: S9 family peptidase [Gemmatimonadaceae bacterium]|nr:S9 family peptidase [Gemmatimonadaceae bacterium]